MKLLLLLALAVPPTLAAGSRLPARIVNPGFEQGLRGWTAAGHRGFRAGGMRALGYSADRAAEGRGWMTAGWAARSRAPEDAAYRIATLVDARRYRGRRMRLSAMTRAPAFADGSSRLTARTFAAGGTAEAETGIHASETWRRHDLVFSVPRDARAIELGFHIERTSGQLDADAVRFEILP